VQGEVEQFCRLQFTTADKVWFDDHVELDVTCTVCVLTVAPFDARKATVTVLLVRLQVGPWLTMEVVA
jgi:hypothetical protein